ncbi:MAG: DUF3796 domain-containing protein [Halothermotrichaceae bacterium]
MTRNNRLKFLGILGFIGFTGFQYFQSHNTTALSYFAFFGFFSFFWISRISSEMADERYLENVRKAKAFTFQVAIGELIILYLTAPLNFITKEILTAALALSFASLIIIYSIAFYRYEKG